MRFPPSELWEMDTDELLFWLERLRAICEAEKEAAKAD